MRKPLLLISAVVLALAGLYAAAGYWLLPGYLQQRLVAEAARVGLELRIGAVRTDPFRLSVELERAELVVAEDLRVLAQRVHADLKLASLLSRDLLPERISLSAGAVDVADSRIQPIQATLVRQSARGEYRVTADGALSVQGNVALAPLKFDAQLSASGLPLAAAQPWLARAARLELAAGSASLRGHVRFDSTGTPRFAYAGSLSLNDVIVHGPEAGAPPLASWRALDGTDV
jgi:hypothetical protein